MCEFCEALTNGKQINWSQRSTLANDNIEEIINKNELLMDEIYLQDYSEFGIYGYKHEDNTWVGIDYKQRFKAKNKEDVINSPFSETIQFNFCPICGEQISNDIKRFSEYSNFIISVEGE